MGRSIGLLVNLQRPFVEGLGISIPALIFVYYRQTINDHGHMGMGWSPDLHVNLQRSFVEGLRLGVLPLEAEEVRQKVQTYGRFGMVWAKGVLSDLHGLYGYRNGFAIVTLLL